MTSRKGIILAGGSGGGAQTTDYYAPEVERSLMWNDPALAIDWPLDGEPISSANDQAALPLAECEVFA